MKWIKVGVVVLLAEAVLVCSLAVLFHFQVLNEKRRIILQSNIVAMSYALQPQPFTSSSSRYFYEYGFPNIVSIFKDPMSTRAAFSFDKTNLTKFSILLEEDILKKGDDELRQIFENPDKFRIQETPEEVKINVPLYRGHGDKPYGIVQVSNTITNLRRDIFFKNFFLYLAIILLYNSQIFLIYLYRRQRRKQTVVYLEKGYLKEHAIGALKLQHKILGDIIADHENIEAAPHTGRKEEAGPGQGGKLIVLERPDDD